MKEYLGDSVYAASDDDGIVLTTEQGDNIASNTIVIDRDVLKHLYDFITINFIEPKKKGK